MHVRDGARDASVAIVERVQRDEPQVSQASLDNRIDVRFAIEPVEEFRDLSFEPRGWRSFVMHFLPADWTRDHLHRAMRVVAPTADCNFQKPAPAGRKQNVVPSEKAVFRERTVIVRCGIDHDRNNALNVPVDGFQAANVNSKTARNRGANCLRIQFFSLDLAAFHDVLGKRFESSILTGGKSQRAHLTAKLTLLVTNSGRQ